MWLLRRLVNKRTKELRIFVEALKQADREWKATFDSVEDAMWVLDCEGRIAHANQATTRIFGKAPEDVTGRTCWEVAHETDEAISECPLKDAAAKRQSRSATVHTVDGRWLQVSVHPVFDEEGTTKGYMHVVSDVTEKRRTEEELDHYRRGLEDLVRRRTEELEAANADLLQAKLAAESADHLKSAFLATMSHELRTPLNSIIGFTGILLQGLAGPLNEEQAKQLRMVQGSARHLLALINDVLDISKIEAGRIELAEEPFDLRAAVERVVQSVAPAAKEKGLQLVCEIGEGVGQIVGDRRRVEQVLMNLLGNAVKFTARGSVTVTCTREDSSAIMSVKDTGIGISAENLQKLFRPFQQVDSGKTREYDGTGLGLHISKRLGELMGGSISVESTPGSGSTFTFRMPIREEGGA
ncbi:PAS domain-containing sensor histidine kinase [Aminiphilus circumscriptus]|uniref:PAS domain-containing sensor histidine kinase n=1 Tax=Aminiphilus circumscriptus TaxID=290732 RepID=UPI0004AFD01A|nr:PAS domain-containing sensor histidine kinase [Aminiphilus circumscriptus]